MKPWKKKSPKPKRGFTLIEILVVLVIILILVGMVMPAINKAITQADKARARESVSQLAAAMRAYFAEFSRWPTNVAATTYLDCCISTNFFNNTSSITFYTANPKEIGVPASGCGGTALGVILDPWKNPYQVRVDTGYTGSVPDPQNATAAIAQGFAVWSNGPDGLPNTADDIKSW